MCLMCSCSFVKLLPDGHTASKPRVDKETSAGLYNLNLLKVMGLAISTIPQGSDALIRDFADIPTTDY